jgi:opacity protein-like surface antigen
MRKSAVLAVLLLLAAGSALAQDEFPRVETAPAFMFVRTPVNFGSFSESFNCAGGGGTFAYNVTKMVGIAADLGGCKYFGQTLPNLSEKIDGSLFTYLFGPRITLRSSSRFRPFFLVNFGGARLKFKCASGTGCSGESFSTNAFAMTAGGGFDIKLNRKFALRPIQAEYLLTRFGNNCQTVNGGQVCLNLGNQNSFRLKSGIVISWGGAK